MQSTTRPPLFCLGHSHIEAIEKAASAAGIPIEAINFWNVRGGPLGQRDAQGNPRFFDDIAARISAHVGPVFSHLGGNPPVLIGTLRHPRPFDFVLPSEPDLPLEPGAEVVPSVAVRMLLEKVARPWIGLMQELARLCDGPVFHVEPPPPSMSSERMAKHMIWDLFPGMTREIAPPVFRYKLWRLHSELLRDVCGPLGIQLIPVPAECRTPEGFLRGRYFGDGTHGNVEYGALMIRHMERYL